MQHSYRGALSREPAQGVFLAHQPNCSIEDKRWHGGGGCYVLVGESRSDVHLICLKNGT